MDDLQVASAMYNSMAGVDAIKSMRKGTRDEIVARQIQSLNVKKELADILEKYMMLSECVSEIRLDIVYEISRGKKDVKTIQIK